MAYIPLTRVMLFEFDLTKSASNKTKHGIDFIEAQKLWEGIVVTLASSHPDEKRFLTIGQIKELYWSAIITYRGVTIRLISVRRARENEKQIYKQAITQSNHSGQS